MAATTPSALKTSPGRRSAAPGRCSPDPPRMSWTGTSGHTGRRCSDAAQPFPDVPGTGRRGPGSAARSVPRCAPDVPVLLLGDCPRAWVGDQKVEHPIWLNPRPTVAPGGLPCNVAPYSRGGGFRSPISGPALWLSGPSELSPHGSGFDFGMTERNAVPVHYVNLLAVFAGGRCRRSQWTGAKLVALVVESSAANTEHLHHSRAAK